MHDLTDLELCQQVQADRGEGRSEAISELIRRHREQWIPFAAEAALNGGRSEEVGTALTAGVSRAASSYGRATTTVRFPDFASWWILHEIKTIQR